MHVQTCNNVYEAKFFREQQTNPTDWVIAPTKDRRRFTVTNLGRYPVMNAPLTDEQERLEEAMEKAEQNTLDYMTRTEAGIRLALNQFAMTGFDDNNLVDRFAKAIAASDVSGTGVADRFRSVLHDLAESFMEMEGRPLTVAEIQGERDDLIKTAADCEWKEY